MALKDEYKKQQEYRDWSFICNRLPLHKDQIIADLGCGVGSFTEIISKKVRQVTAIDLNINLLEVLKQKKIENIIILEKDISNLDYIPYEFHGIFSSFVIAYFPNKEKEILRNWHNKLKVGGWLAIVEIDNLLRGHQPLSLKTTDKLKEFEQNILNKNLYNFNSGRNIITHLKDLKMEILLNIDVDDIELTSSGILSEEIINMWKNRLDRLSFSDFFPQEEVKIIKKEFLSLLKNPNHINKTKVKLILAKKIYK